MPDLGKLSEIDLARLIRRNIIYADKKLVIFNKPYGLPMHGAIRKLIELIHNTVIVFQFT